MKRGDGIDLCRYAGGAECSTDCCGRFQQPNFDNLLIGGAGNDTLIGGGPGRIR